MKKLCTILAFLLFISGAQAQEMLGIANSNYAGTNGISLNPSSMVDSRLEMDVNIGAIGISGDNDYLFFSRDSLNFFGFKRIYKLAGNRGYSDKFSFSNTEKQFNLGIYSLLRGPSAIFHIKKHWVGITTQMRGAASISGVGAPIAKFAFEKDGLKFDPLQSQNFDDATFDIAAMVWSEIGLSYGHEIYNKEKHYLKGAFTVKRLFGYASAFVKNRGVSYNVQNDSLFTVSKLDVQYGHAFDEDIKNTHYKNLVNGSGWGFDFGIAYEYRPDYNETRYEMDGERIEDPNANHYKLKVGLSIYDIGKINFDHDAEYFDLSASKGAVWAGYDTINFLNTADFDKRVSAYAFSGDSGKSYKADHYSIGLPHALSLQVDYNVWKGFYTNATWIQSIHTDNVAVSAASLISLTPRYEFKWFEAALPLSMYQYSAFRLGLAFRLGSLIIGSDKFGSLLGLSNLGGMDVYLGLKFSLPRNRVKDSDADGVSDKRDKCRGERGTWATLGCPDRDNDGILDKEDSCPDVKGIAKFQGCPDTDDDGIQDNQDDCPQTAGLPQFKGCPDTDGDNIPDPQDSCATIAGIPEFYGCPDTDGDHIPDQNDSCPAEKGLIQYNGCPDTDGDGLIDKTDSCPQVAGPAANHGCPVIEKVEVKPVKVELTKEEEEVINKVFKNLEFETGKSVIRSSSFSSLDELSVLLQKKPKFKLLVDGHTDNVGKAPYNLKLSQSRAESVKKYLEGKGVDASRITPKGYGMTKPIASNKTPDGRQKNRRVEFTIVE